MDSESNSITSVSLLRMSQDGKLIVSLTLDGTVDPETAVELDARLGTLVSQYNTGVSKFTMFKPADPKSKFDSTPDSPAYEGLNTLHHRRIFL